jgi:hypothetical protein
MKYSKEACEGWLEVGDMVSVVYEGDSFRYKELGFVAGINDRALVMTCYKIAEENAIGEHELDLTPGFRKAWDRIVEINVLKPIN